MSILDYKMYGALAISGAIAVAASVGLISTRTELSGARDQLEASNKALKESNAKLLEVATTLNVERAATAAKAKTVEDLSNQLAEVNKKSAETKTVVVTKVVERYITDTNAKPTNCGLSPAATTAINDMIKG